MQISHQHIFGLFILFFPSSQQKPANGKHLLFFNYYNIFQTTTRKKMSITYLKNQWVFCLKPKTADVNPVPISLPTPSPHTEERLAQKYLWNIICTPLITYSRSNNHRGYRAICIKTNHPVLKVKHMQSRVDNVSYIYDVDGCTQKQRKFSSNSVCSCIIAVAVY